MRKWKELKKDDLPKDILTGKYFFEEKNMFSGEWMEIMRASPRWKTIKQLEAGAEIRYANA